MQPRGQAGSRVSSPAPRSARRQSARSSASRLGAVVGRSRRPRDGDADAALGVHLREPDRARLADPLAEQLGRPVGVDVRRQPERDLGDDPRRDDRVVADDDRREALVRHDEAGVVGRAQPRVREPHVLDGAGDVLDGHEVADPDRLGDEEQDPGHRVGERLAGREADDRGGEGAGGEDARREAVQRRELGDRDRDADDRDRGLDDPPDEAQARVGDRVELDPQPRAHPAPLALDDAVDEEDEHRGDERGSAAP